MREICALVWKDLRILMRDKAGLFFTVGFPLVFAVFFGVISSSFAGGGGGSAMPVAIVDEDGTEASRKFVDALSADAGIEARAAARAEAASLVRRGKMTAYVVVPKGFAEQEQRMFAGESVRFEMGVDPSRTAESGMLEGILMRTALKPMQDAMGGRQPVTVERIEVRREWHGPKNAYAITFPQGIIWGIMGCAAAFGISLVTERVHGTLPRLSMAPISRAHILGGKALACFCSIVAVTAALLLFAAIVFGVRFDSLPLLGFGIFCNALGFVGIMMLLSVLGRTEQSAGGIGWGVLVIFAMIGGGMIPLFVMPRWLQSLASISPVKWGILGMEGAIWRGFSFTEMLLPCGILVGIGLACFWIGVTVFRWSER